MNKIIRTGIGQDSHRFIKEDSSKQCKMAGIIFDDCPGFLADSDGDVVFHAICNAITSLTHVPILGKIAIDLCHKDGITDSEVYLKKAKDTLNKQKITHKAITIEGKRPRMQKKIDSMRENIARVLNLKIENVGITATSGDGLTDFGCAEGVQSFCVVTTEESVNIS